MADKWIASAIVLVLAGIVVVVTHQAAPSPKIVEILNGPYFQVSVP